MRLTYPLEAQAPAELGTIELDDGGRLRYLRYADGVWEQALDAFGKPRLLRQYEPISTWPTSQAAAIIAANRRYNLDGAA